MQGRPNRQPTRQFKALASLVICMTLGTFVLTWLHDLTPATGKPATSLRSVQARRPTWDRIVVETVSPTGLRADGSVRGFHHLHVDRDGIVHPSSEWREERHDPHGRGAIRIVVSTDRGSASLTPLQWNRLTELLRSLQRTYGIPRDRVVSAAGRLDSASSRHREHLETMLKTR